MNIHVYMPYGCVTPSPQRDILPTLQLAYYCLCREDHESTSSSSSDEGATGKEENYRGYGRSFSAMRATPIKQPDEMAKQLSSISSHSIKVGIPYSENSTSFWLCYAYWQRSNLSFKYCWHVRAHVTMQGKYSASNFIGVLILILPIHISVLDK